MTDQTSRLAVIIDSTAAEKNADNLATALGKMKQAGEEAAASAGKVTKATDEEKTALAELLDRIDPVNAALNKLDKQQRDLAKFKAKGMVDSETFELYSKQIEDTRNKLTGFSSQLTKTGMSAKQTANNRRMIPAQFTDIIVSLQAGQNPLQVFLQQGGQLKDIFGGVGPALKATGTYVLVALAWAAIAIAVASVAYALFFAPGAGDPGGYSSGTGDSLDVNPAKANRAKLGDPIRELFGRRRIYPERGAARNPIQC